MIKSTLNRVLVAVLVSSFCSQTELFSAELKDNAVSTVKAEVLYVHKQARQLSVVELEGLGPDAKDPVNTSNWFLRTYSVAPNVDAFNAIKAGDQVVLSIDMSLSLDIRKPTEAEAANPFQTQTVSETQKDKVLKHVITAVCEVVAVDTKNNRITFKGPGGRKFSVPAGKGELEGRGKVGDKVVVNYTQGAVVAISRVQ
jgi:hypothetical protein